MYLKTTTGDGPTRLLNAQSRRVAPPGVGAQRDTYMDLKTRVQNRLLAELDPAMDISRINDVRGTIQELFEQVLSEESIVLTRPERHRLFEQIAAEILGFGPIQPLLEDETHHRNHGQWREEHLCRASWKNCSCPGCLSKAMIMSCALLTVLLLRWVAGLMNPARM